MNQIFRIFIKDARHLYAEIGISLIILMGVTMLGPFRWSTSQPVIPILDIFLWILLPLVWLVLIARVVHADALVGDKQFWITRPYTWYWLLGSKIVFLCIAILLPFLVANCLNSISNGNTFAAVFGHALRNDIALFFLFVLPLTSIAAVTEDLPRFALISLSAVLYILALLTAGARFFHAHTGISHRNELLILLFAIALILVLIFQYSTRRTLVSRSILLAIPIALLLSVLIA